MTALNSPSAIISVEQLLQRVRTYQPEADEALLRRAYSYAIKAHDGQVRKSGEPYFSHPAAVARVITELRLDIACVCAGLLHDVVEDTSVTLEDIENEFGREIAFLVDGVTKLSKIDFSSRQERDAENFRKMLVAMSRDIRVLLLKLCDRVDNMRTLQFMKTDAQERISRETMEIFAPLAARLGIHRFKIELEDLAFRYLEPESFETLSRRVAQTDHERNKFSEKMCALLRGVLTDHGFSGEVFARTKHLFSIHRQMLKQNVQFECLRDLVTFRVIIASVADCYSVMGALHSRYTPVPGRIKDYIALPKPNMYQSLHTTVMGPDRKRVEIQIRTPDMERVALEGIAAQWVYKENSSGGANPKLIQRLPWLRDLMDSQRNIRDAAEFLDSIKVDLFQDEVYAFTPKGEVRVFPSGSSTIDFAYAVHTEVGHHAVGARVNGTLVPLQYELQNGDVVEILTSTDQRPKKDWLNSAASARARNRIRAFLRSDERERALKIGRGLLEKNMHKHGVSLQRLIKTQPELSRVLELFEVQSVHELFVAIGYGKISPQAVVRSVTQQVESDSDAPKPIDHLREGRIEQLLRKITGRDGEQLRLGEIGNEMVHYARCCSPLPGDEIVGIFTRRRGITVHRTDCSNAFETDSDRRVPVVWDASVKITHSVQLNVLAANRPGVLGSMGNTFSEQHVNLTMVTSRSIDDGRSVSIFTFTCEDLARLRSIMRALRKVEGVYSVERI